MMPSMSGMFIMSIRLTRGILGAPLMEGYMTRLEVNGWEIVGVGCRAQDKVRNHGNASNANDIARDGDWCSYQ
jgi:hypothetical protein